MNSFLFIIMVNVVEKKLRLSHCDCSGGYIAVPLSSWPIKQFENRLINWWAAALHTSCRFPHPPSLHYLSF